MCVSLFLCGVFQCMCVYVCLKNRDWGEDKLCGMCHQQRVTPVLQSQSGVSSAVNHTLQSHTQSGCVISSESHLVFDEFCFALT